ncbi:hypothetical protein GCK32_015775 [Trichostrongylus colubriformis]|uniref:Uncharacterized protein n=1 Tax=Trichostrongylus colubriformis TaxID=6319 RepID=A0AAN8J0R8_TRICO
MTTDVFDTCNHFLSVFPMCHARATTMGSRNQLGYVASWSNGCDRYTARPFPNIMCGRCITLHHFVLFFFHFFYHLKRK